MFTQKCFIRKNTKEVTSIIENIGYKLLFTARRNEGKYLVCANKLCFGQDDELPCGYIDCGDNEDLFFAIAALRDDTDKNQYFTCAEDSEFILCKTDIFEESFLYDKELDLYNEIWTLYRKATVEELIEHFKK